MVTLNVLSSNYESTFLDYGKNKIELDNPSQLIAAIKKGAAELP